MKAQITAFEFCIILIRIYVSNQAKGFRKEIETLISPSSRYSVTHKEIMQVTNEPMFERRLC